MLIDRVQRWRERRGAYRVPSEVIDARRYEAALIREDTVARAFVQRHHCAATAVRAHARKSPRGGGAPDAAPRGRKRRAAPASKKVRAAGCNPATLVWRERNSPYP